MPEREVDTYQVHPFEINKVCPHYNYPLIDVSVIELNRNLDNYFAEIE